MTEQMPSIAQQQLDQQALIETARNAYNLKRMELIDKPMLELDKDKLQYQAALDAVNTRLQEGTLTGYYAPNNFTVSNAGEENQTIDWQNTAASQHANYQSLLNFSVNQPPGAGTVGANGVASNGVLQGATSPGGSRYSPLALQSVYGMSPENANALSQSLSAFQAQAGREPSEAEFNQLAQSTHAMAQNTLARDQFETSTGLQALAQQAALRGPRNAFQQVAYNQGLNSEGLSKYVDQVAGKYDQPGYQAPQAAAQPVTFATMAADMRNNAAGNIYQGGAVMSPTATPGMGQGGLNYTTNPQQGLVYAQQPQPPSYGATTGQGMDESGAPTYTAPATAIAGNGRTEYQRQLDAIPNANKVNRTFFQGNQSGRDFILSGAEAKGLDATDYEAQARRAALPTVGGATYGSMR